MRWSIFVCLLVCLARFCDAGALRCPPGVLDSSCMEEKKELETPETSGSGTAEAQCLVGTEWESNCHYCRCSNTGVAECLKMDTCDKGLYAEPALCKPNTTFQRDCNTCVCLDNGLGLCTLEHCRSSNNIKDNLELSEESEKEAATKSETHVLVIPTTRSLNNATKSQVCVANRMFVKDCNTCWCNEDGTSYVCTRRTCVPLLPGEESDLGGIPAEELRVTKQACRPDEVFELDCNMCRCNSDGKSYSCTRRACAEPDDDKKVNLSRKIRSFTTEMPKTCQPGQEFRMDCNKCLCDSKGQDFSCTRNDCNAPNNNHGVRRKRDVPVSRVSEPIEMKCVAGSVFDRDCNVCRCTDDGNHATCTIKRCEKDNELDGGVHPTGGLGSRLPLQSWRTI
ncbi:unnamed protein product [Arctia plantaginis]|uniref:Pacifastin domain-containing protein n=1 Tax=Arctia plantaginis TaxID=874455 RepID=A0A8S0Z9H8_ARCPL|nr:unnamed protein product [Arctia plantaginis]